MTAIAFTGARELSGEREGRIVAMVVKHLPADTLVITGACLGVDALVARLATIRGLRVHTVLPANRYMVDPEWRSWCETFEEMPTGSSFKDRNTRLVELGEDGVAVIAAYPEQHPQARASGTWQTKRIAERWPRPILGPHILKIT